MTNCELFVLFDKFGRVTEVHNTRKGFAFVTFEMKDNAVLAMRKMNGTTVNGQNIIVDIATLRNSKGITKHEPWVLSPIFVSSRFFRELRLLKLLILSKFAMLKLLSSILVLSPIFREL